MAKTNTQSKDSFRISLLRKLTLAPEARNQPAKEPYPAGRIKKFIDILRANYSQLTLVNALCLIFALPLIVVVGYVMTQGFESFTYQILGIDKPYLLTNFGFGISAGASLADVKLNMLASYRVFITAIALCLPILSIGLAGVNHIVTKLVWGEDFICKKDKLGNKVPRMALEFFRGIKLFWKQSLLFMSVYAFILAGAGNLVISFVAALWSGTAGAGEYIMLIFAVFLLLISSLIMVNLLPTVVSYNIKIIDKIKNSVILTIAFIVPSFFIFVMATFLLYFIPVSGVVVFFVSIIFLMIGLCFAMLIFANYADYNAEKVLTPLYEMSLQESKRPKKSEPKKAQHQKQQNTESKPQSTGDAMQSAEEKPQNQGSKPQNQGNKPQNQGNKPQNKGNKSHKGGGKPHKKGKK